MTPVHKKRESAFEKAAYIIKPFIIYMIMKTMILLGLSLLVSTLPLEGIEQMGNQLNAVINAAASLVGVSFVLRDFVTEIDTKGEVLFDVSVWKQFGNCIKKGFQNCKGKEIQLGAVLSLGLTSALFLNGLITRLSFSSEQYAKVEQIQYSVPVWLGLILYGLISPVVEEIVFRGLTYHRMRRFFGIPGCVIVSALLFGGFHANLPQFVYGTAMGMLMALCYEWTDTFAAPVLFHMAANILIFLISGLPQVSQTIASTPGIVIFFLLSIACVAATVLLSRCKICRD